MTSAEQRQPKLNMNGGSFSERLVRFENELSGLLTALDSSRLNEHTRLALGAPWGLGDEAHFEEPAVFSLLAYGLPGITALESIASLAETDVTSAGVHPALRALATAALGLGEYAASSVWLAHRYPSLDDSAFELLEAAVRATCASGDARARADEAVRRVLSRVRANPVHFGQAVQLLEMSFQQKAPERIKQWVHERASPIGEVLPARFGPWRVIRALGHGGQATTYVVIHEGDSSQTERALKVLKPWAKEGKAASEAEQRGRFRREVNALRDLAATGCPNIVPVLDADLTGADGQPWYVMPFYSSTLHREIERHKGQIDAVLSIAERVGDTLAWMHGNEPVRTHRDVHTENIFLDAIGSPVLGDFGLVHIESEAAGAVHTGAREGFGPWRWRPPELHPGSPMQHHPKSDVYLLGGVIYEALTGGEYIEETEHGDRFTHEDPSFSIGRFTEDPRVPHVNRLLRYMLARNPDGRMSSRQIVDRCRSIRQWTASGPDPVAVPPADALRAAVSRYAGRSTGLRLEAQAREMLSLAQRVCSEFKHEAPTSYDVIRRVSATQDRNPRHVGPDEVISKIRVVITIELQFPPAPELKMAGHVEFTSTADMRWHLASLEHMDSDFRHVATFVEGDVGIAPAIRALVQAEISRLELSLADRLENGLRR